MSISNLGKENPENRGAIRSKTTSEKPNLNDGDWLNFYLLIMLYTIQGFPIGLSFALSTILQEKKMITYSEQAVFSMATWPYILKIVWAPIIDALYVRWIGRRKSWLLPLQLSMGSVLLFMAANIDEWLPKTGVPNLNMLAIVVFVLNFLSATQDIVVDGWSLTMLKKRNVGYCSTCNSVGVSIGMFTSSVCFVMLVSEKFRDTYIRTTAGSGGLITMQSFLYFWSIVVFSVTITVAIFKNEKQTMKNNEKRINVFQNYKLLLEILRLPRMKLVTIALLTARIGFSTNEGVSHLKLIEAGVMNEKIMLINSVMYAVKFVMPVFISKYITGPKPMSYYFKMTPYKLLWGLAFAALVYYTQNLTHTAAGALIEPWYYTWILGFVYLINEMLSLFMTLAMFSFLCRLCDPRFGGTYMTLLSTFYYVGWLLPITVSLKLVALLTFSQCSTDVQNACSTPKLIELCKSDHGSCNVNVDGYYIAMAICTFIGFVWFGVFRNIIRKYQLLNISHWMVFDKESITEVKEPFIMSSASA